MLAFLQGALQAAIPVCAGADEVEVWRTPWLEAPTEDFLVEGPGAIDLVCVDGKVADMIRHGHPPGLGCVPVASPAAAFLRKNDNFSREGDDLETFLRTLGASYGHGHEIGEHAHGWAQLVFAESGAIHVTAAGQAWLIPSARAVWLPPDTTHCLRMRGETRLRTVYVPPERCGALFPLPLGIAVTSLLRELILELVRIGHVDAANRHHRAVGEAMLATLARAERLPWTLTLPVDRRALQVAHAIMADPASERVLADLASKSGGSLRTIQRRFVDETGMSLSEWRQVARLMKAAALLLDGETVTEAALGAGYAGVSAFIHAFRRKVGQTPSDFRSGSLRTRRA